MFSDTRHLAIACLVVAIVLLIAYEMRGESFTTMEEKANAVYSWFKENPSGSYRRYRNDLNRGSNIVEYESMRELIQKKPNFTLADVKEIV